MGHYLRCVATFLKENALPLTLIFLLIFLLRMPSFTQTVIDWDESFWWTVSQDIANGGSLYQTTWEPKGPILFFIFVPIIKLFGNNILALRIFTTVYLLISMLFIFFICKRLFGGKIATLSPLIYGLFFTQQKFGGLASNRELFMMLPIIIAIFYFLEYLYGKSKSSQLFLCGLFSAIAVFTVQTAFIIIILFPLLLITKKIKMKNYAWSNFAYDFLIYSSGGFLISALVLSYFIIHNSLYEFYHAFYLWNYYYVGAVTISDALTKLSVFLQESLRSDAVTIAAFVSIIALILNKETIKEQIKIKYFLVCLFFLSLIAVIGGRYMWSHYYLHMGLVFSVLICYTFSELKVDENRFRKLICAITIILIVLNFEIVPGFLTSLKSYKNNELYKIAEYIDNRTTTQDKIFVLGGEPMIYFLANRIAPTKFFEWLLHRGPQLYALQQTAYSEDVILAEFSKEKPKYFIFNPWQGRGFNNDVVYFNTFITDNYQLETEIGGYLLYALK